MVGLQAGSFLHMYVGTPVGTVEGTFKTIFEMFHLEERSVGDPDPDVFGLPDPDPLVRGADPDPSLFS
jgi:hypothetical protein